ncbi:glycosyl-4,4'-diaponeurosporenoate acyltransferase CrtO family protein [Terriglobus aquaticus]|uniref:Glycosyl-4,4'-diaponeurosporenoate acyltransferase n=1 Tax=Terriglobus aquaticus TaxID=940139 RepID=A0ABW9KLK4_9BACT|nr:hypothetical protein [Terriglobus aquaticus]
MSGRRQSLNLLVSAVWTALFVLPVYTFCAKHTGAAQLVLFLIAGILASIVPRAILRRLQLSANPLLYRRLRVPLLVRFTQDAPWLKRLSSGAAANPRHTRATLQGLMRDSWMRERFHLGLGVFYALCSAVALLHMLVAWAVVLTAANLVYNIYPIWLQQYLRLRIKPLLRH